MRHGDEDGAQLGDVLPGLLGRARSGRLTISTSGTPARLKSISEASLPWIRPSAPPTCGLAGVLLDVGPLDANAGPVGQVEPAVDVEGYDVVLADLVRLGHVRVEVVLAMEDAVARCS